MSEAYELKVWGAATKALDARREDRDKDAWSLSDAALKLVDKVEKEHPGNEVVGHKRLNLLAMRVELLSEHRTNGKKLGLAGDQTERLLETATACIAAVPARFKKDSPFGAACIDAWKLGHRALAAHSPARDKTWAKALRTFDAAVDAVRNAPRTHAEGRLKSSAAFNQLLRLGREMPWMPAPAKKR